jgi:hypothetical protein
MGFARRLTRPRIAEFHRGLALLLSLARYPENSSRLGRERVHHERFSRRARRFV